MQNAQKKQNILFNHIKYLIGYHKILKINLLL